MLNMHEWILKMIRHLEDATLDAQKFDDGSKISGSRVRKKLSELAKECKEMRSAILEIQKQRKM